MNKGKTITKTIGYVDKLTGDVIPINEVLAATETPIISDKQKPDVSKREIDLGHKICVFDRAEYSNQERTNLRIHYYENHGDSDTKEFDLQEHDPSRKWLVDQIYALTDKDTIMENTYQRIVAEEAAFKEFAIRQGKEYALPAELHGRGWENEPAKAIRLRPRALERLTAEERGRS